MSCKLGRVFLFYSQIWNPVQKALSLMEITTPEPSYIRRGCRDSLERSRVLTMVTVVMGVVGFKLLLLNYNSNNTLPGQLTIL